MNKFIAIRATNVLMALHTGTGVQRMLEVQEANGFRGVKRKRGDNSWNDTWLGTVG